MFKAQPWLSVSSRVGAALIGGYVFAWGFTALVVALNLAAGGEYWEGVTLAYLLAFLVVLVVFLWAFAARNLVRVWFVLAGGAIVMTSAARWLTPSLG